MSQLAYDENGQPFQVPATVTHFRVRRFSKPGQRGGAALVHDEDGLPLLVDVDAQPSEFREAVGSLPGRYRLDGVDSERRTVDKVPPAYLEISEPRAKRGEAGGAPPPSSALEYALVAIVDMARANSEALRVMTEQASGMMNAGADVVRAADSAGMSRRKPMAELAAGGHDEDEDDDDSNDDEDENDEELDDGAQPGSEVSAVISQIMSAVSMVVGMRGGEVPKVGAFFGQGNAVKAVEPARATGSEHDPAAPEAGIDDDAGARARSTDDADSGGASDPMGHFLRIQAQLTPKERTYVERAVAKLGVSDLMQWRDQLAQVSVNDAVTMIRAEIARTQEKSAP